MNIGDSIYQVLNYFFPQAFPIAAEKTGAQVEEAANEACWQDIYSEPCARLSDLSEQKGGINVRRELMDLDARIRPMLNQMFAAPAPEGGYCPQILENSCSAQGYEVLQCTEDPIDPSSTSLQIFLVPSGTRL